MIKQAPTISEATWNEMSGKAKWDSIVALRGPDIKSSDTIKFFTNSVIRHRLSKVMRVGGMVNSYFSFVVLPDKSLKMDDRVDLSHFLQHITEAAEWLGVNRIYIPVAEWEKVMFGSHHLNACKKLLKLLPDGDERNQVQSYLQEHGLVFKEEE